MDSRNIHIHPHHDKIAGLSGNRLTKVMGVLYENFSNVKRKQDCRVLIDISTSLTIVCQACHSLWGQGYMFWFCFTITFIYFVWSLFDSSMIMVAVMLHAALIVYAYSIMLISSLHQEKIPHNAHSTHAQLWRTQKQFFITAALGLCIYGVFFLT